MPTDAEFQEYLESEARRRGVDVETIRREEADAMDWLAKNTPSNEELRKLAEKSKAEWEARSTADTPAA